jgi:flagellar biosynthesis protein FlhG
VKWKSVKRRKGETDVDIQLEKDLKISRAKFGLLKDMLVLVFPEVHTIQKDFLIQLTPDELKRAYMSQAAACHPDTAEELNREERKTRQMRYQRLSMAYKALLPHIENIHQKVRGIESRQNSKSFKEESPSKTILAVGGAKGGVGKSVLATNLAVGLALLGQRVVLADLDLGGADAHLLLGVKSLSADWNSFLEKNAHAINKILTPTPFDGLSLIGGNSSKLGSANLTYSQKKKIIHHLKTLECDYIIVDLGGDTSFNVLDFFLLADQKIVVTSAEPTSFLDTYNFVKVSFYRFLDRFFTKHAGLKDLCGQIHELSLGKTEGPTLESIFQKVRATDLSAYIKLKLHIEEFHISIVTNMIDNRKDVSIAESMQRLLKKKCFLDIGILGAIPFDTAVRKSARRFTPFIVDDPRCKASQVLNQMLAGILLLREPQSIRAELLEKAKLIRDDAKNQIGGSAMTLDGLTEEQISFISDRAPNLRHGFQKILRLVAN